MMIFSSYSRECDKHNVNVFCVLSERVSERRSRKQDTDIGLDLHINVTIIGYLLNENLLFILKKPGSLFGILILLRMFLQMTG